MAIKKLILVGVILAIITLSIAYLFDAPYWESFQLHYMPEFIALFVFGVVGAVLSKRIRLNILGIIAAIAIFGFGVIFLYGSWLNTELSITLTAFFGVYGVGFVIGWYSPS